ncbi:MAG: hypothetical protein ACXVAK_03875 [Vulcanimicrobiaceae bacterium]
MRHYDAGALRRMLDEPGAFAEDAQAHVRTCDVCRARGAAVRDDAAFAARLLGDDAVARTASVLPMRVHRRIRPMWAAIGGLAAAAALVLALVFTPLGGYAGGFLTIFQPKQFATVDVTQTDLEHFKLLPQADQLGTARDVIRPHRIDVASFSGAQSRVDFTLRHPTAIPASVGAKRSVAVQTPGEFTFTFSAQKARAYAKRQHKTLRPMPTNLNGTTVRVVLGPMVVASYGSRPERMHKAFKDDGRLPEHVQPFLMFVQARAPKVTSTGASLAVLENYMLAMPGMPPQLASQIRALGDLSQTVPVPIRPDKQTAQQITIDGAQGLAIGDNTGLGAGVVWQKNGIVYGVGGPLSEDEVLAFANGLR